MFLFLFRKVFDLFSTSAQKLKISFQTLVENKNNNNYSNNKNANKKKNWLGFASPFGNFGVKTIYPDYYKREENYVLNSQLSLLLINSNAPFVILNNKARTFINNAFHDVSRRVTK